MQVPNPIVHARALARRLTRRLAVRMTRWCCALGAGTSRWCGYVWHRLTTEPGYADAVAALLYTLAELFAPDAGARRAAQEVARLVALALRAVLGDRLDPDWT
jgi:hypothetical protein